PSFPIPIEAGSTVSVAEPLAERAAAAPTVPDHQPPVAPEPYKGGSNPPPPTNPIIPLRQPPPLAQPVGEGPGLGATLGEHQPLAAPERSEGGSTPQPSTKFNRHTGKIG